MTANDKKFLSKNEVDEVVVEWCRKKMMSKNIVEKWCRFVECCRKIRDVVGLYGIGENVGEWGRIGKNVVG